MKFLKNNLKLIIGFIVGVILASSITVYATICFAKDITYKNGKSVEDALNELYSNKRATLLWTNNSKSSAFNPQTISLDLSTYKYVLIITESNVSTNNNPKATSLLKVSNDVPTTGSHELTNKISLTANASSYVRGCYITNTGVTLGNAYGDDGKVYNDRIIPLFIYGIKYDLGIDANIGY